jgi:DNA-binding ferritin-like protein
MPVSHCIVPHAAVQITSTTRSIVEVLTNMMNLVETYRQLVQIRDQKGDEVADVVTLVNEVTDVNIWQERRSSSF